MVECCHCNDAVRYGRDHRVVEGDTYHIECLRPELIHVRAERNALRARVEELEAANRQLTGIYTALVAEYQHYKETHP